MGTMVYNRIERLSNNCARYLFFVEEDQVMMINESPPPNSIIDVPELSAYAKLLYIYLFLCADSSGQAFPSDELLSEKLSASVRTVKQAVRELKKVELVTVDRLKDGEGNFFYRYTINPEKLDDLLPKEED